MASVVLMEFPSMADAKHWYNSPEYQKILPLRVGTAISDLILLDGVGLEFSVADVARQVRAVTGGQRPSRSAGE